MGVWEFNKSLSPDSSIVYGGLKVERKFFWKNGKMNPDNLIVREIIALVPNLKMYKNVYNGDKCLRRIK